MQKKLFRGKRVDNGEWVYGYYIRYGFNGQEKEYIVPSYASALYAIEVIPETVGQYTWLTDNNANKIFEGDIIKAKHYYQGDLNDNEFLEKKIRNAYGKKIEGNVFYKEYTYLRNYIVEYSSKKGTWIGRNGSDQHPLISLRNFYHCGEVIGNIHDNPELLEVK